MSDYFTGWTKNEKLEVETFKSSCHCGRFEFEFRYPTLGASSTAFVVIASGDPIRLNRTSRWAKAYDMQLHYLP